MRNHIQFTPIGIIHTPITDPEGVPVQAQGGKNIMGSVEVYERFAAGFKDLSGFSHRIQLSP